MRALFYEKRIRSLDKLKAETRRLDADSGVRVVGFYQDTPCFAFVTRSARTYTVMVYERKGLSAPTVGARIFSKEFGNFIDLDRFLRQITRRGVDSYVY